MAGAVRDEREERGVCGREGGRQGHLGGHFFSLLFPLGINDSWTSQWLYMLSVEWNECRVEVRQTAIQTASWIGFKLAMEIKWREDTHSKLFSRICLGIHFLLHWLSGKPSTSTISFFHPCCSFNFLLSTEDVGIWRRLSYLADAEAENKLSSGTDRAPS